jgi:hypothetical protein
VIYILMDGDGSYCCTKIFPFLFSLFICHEKCILSHILHCLLFCRTHDSSDETIINSSANESYTHDFDTATDARTATKEKKTQETSKDASTRKAVTVAPTASSIESRLSRLAKEKGLDLKRPRSPKSPLVARRPRGESGSESEDSFSNIISGIVF